MNRIKRLSKKIEKLTIKKIKNKNKIEKLKVKRHELQRERDIENLRKRKEEIK